jgi:hypothetical protein
VPDRLDGRHRSCAAAGGSALVRGTASFYLR